MGEDIREQQAAQYMDLLEAYLQMAADEEREAGASEWTEGLIADAC